MRTWPTKSTKKDSEELEEIDGQSRSLRGFALGPHHIFCDCLVWDVCGTPNSGRMSISDSLACSW